MAAQMLVVMYPDLMLRFGRFNGEMVSNQGHLYADPACTRLADLSTITSPIWPVEVFTPDSGGLRWHDMATRWNLSELVAYQADDVDNGIWPWVPYIWPKVFNREWEG